MKVIVNGTERERADGTTVLSLLESLRLSPDKVAVELNRRLLRSANYDRVLQAGDQVEVVTFVGGG
jgi:thiamine biosynthesis protein ThiS